MDAGLHHVAATGSSQHRRDSRLGRAQPLPERTVVHTVHPASRVQQLHRRRRRCREPIQSAVVARSAERYGLLVHGYGASKKAVWANPVTGASAIVWGRTLGWYVTGLVETLELLMVDQSLPAFQHLRAVYAEFGAAIGRAVDQQADAWWQVVTQPGRGNNYLESSSTALLAYPLLKGARLGFVH